MNLKTAAREIFTETLSAIEAETVTRGALQLSADELTVNGDVCDLSEFSRILVITIGKAGIPMARAAADVLGDRFHEGLIVTNAVGGEMPARMRVLIGGHPVPDEQSLAAAEAALLMLRAADSENTLALFLISGGGSALFEKPIDDSLTLADLQEVNRVLVGCGAVIKEMNVVRRYLSAVKGGRLAAAAPRARQVSLYISDVNSDDLATIASGPTLASRATKEDFARIVARYDLLNKFPVKVSELIRTGRIPDLPQPDERVTHLHTHHLLLDNRRALGMAQQIAARQSGCVVEIAEDLVEGDVEAMARQHIQRIAALRAKHPGKPVCLLSGGEVICPVRGKGQGGRNQEFVLRAAIALHESGEANIAVLSAGTDGIDGNSPAAGAVGDGQTIWQARTQGLTVREYLDNSDSFRFFAALGDAIVIGPTGNNVRDLRILLAM